MALKRRSKINADFSMSSMTDIIFLLLLFFVISSTMSTPNDIKLNLPKSGVTNSAEKVAARVSIDADGKYYLATDNRKVEEVSPELLEQELLSLIANDSANYIALYADQDIAYKEVVKVLDIANRNRLKLVIATSVEKNK